MNIRAIREKQQLTQNELADKLGIKQTTVSKWETTDTCPTANLLPKIAKILNCTIDDLFGNEKQNQRTEPASKAESVLAMCDSHSDRMEMQIRQQLK